MLSVFCAETCAFDYCSTEAVFERKSAYSNLEFVLLTKSIRSLEKKHSEVCFSYFGHLSQ